MCAAAFNNDNTNYNINISDNNKYFFLYNLAYSQFDLFQYSHLQIIGWFEGPYRKISLRNLELIFETSCKEIWTYEDDSEFSPRFQQWIKSEQTTWIRGEYWLPDIRCILYGFDPNVKHQFVYGIKLQHNITADKIYVAIKNMQDIECLSTLGVNYVNVDNQNQINMFYKLLSRIKSIFI